MSPTLPALYGAATLLLNSAIWIFGGDSNPLTNGTFSIDVSKSWSTSSPPFTNYPSNDSSDALPPRLYSSMALGPDGSSLWIYGGASNSTDFTNSKQFSTFNTKANTWSSNGINLPTVFAQSAVEDSKGVVYYYGGSSDLTDTGLSSFSSGPGVSKLDTHTGNFSQLDDASGNPGPLAWHTATLVNDTLMYVIGGLEPNPGNDFPVTVYNTAANTWNPPINSAVQPSNRYGHTAVLTSDKSKIIVFGGTATSSQTNLNDVWTLNLATNQWMNKNTTGTAPSGRTFHSSVMVNDQMIVMFGYSQTALNTVYVLDTTKWAWVTSFNLPSPPSSNGNSSSNNPDSTEPSTNPKPAISVAGIAGIVLAVLAVISIVMLSIIQPRNRVKPL